MWKASDGVAIKSHADCKGASLAPRRQLSELALLLCTSEKYSQVISAFFEESDATPRLGNPHMQCTTSGRHVVEAPSWRQLERFLIDDHHLEYWIETCRLFCSF